MEYISITLLTITISTVLVYIVSNKVFRIQIRLIPLVLCALGALVISIVLPRIIVGFAGLAGTFAILCICAFIFAYLIAYYYDQSSDETKAELEETPPTQVEPAVGLINASPDSYSPVHSILGTSYTSDSKNDSSDSLAKVPDTKKDFEPIELAPVEMSETTIEEQLATSLTEELALPDLAEALQAEELEEATTQEQPADSLKEELALPDLAEALQAEELEEATAKEQPADSLAEELALPDLAEALQAEELEEATTQEQPADSLKEELALPDLAEALQTEEWEEATTQEQPTDSLAEELALPDLAEAFQTEGSVKLTVVDNISSEIVEETLDSTNEVIYPDAEDIDSLLDFAFLCKEQRNYSMSLKAFRHALKLYPDNEAAPFLVIEIGTILKNEGLYDEAIRLFSEAKNLPSLQNDPILEQEFISTVAYLRIVKNVLLQHRLGFISFSNIPNAIVKEIDDEFKEWRNLVV